MKRLSATLAAVAVALPAASLAQAKWVEIADDVTVTEFGQTVGAIDDWEVMGPDGARIGEVEEVIGRDANAATALTVDFDDGAGFGDRDDVIVPLDKFSFADNRLTLNVDAEAVGGMEIYDDD